MKKDKEPKEVRKFIVKFFEQSPFDKSSYIRDVQVLCDIDTGEPYAHLDSPLDWTGQELTSEDIRLEHSSKKSKHLVPGDSVTFGPHQFYEGEVDKIEEDDEDNWEDTFYLKNCSNTIIKNKIFEGVYEEIPTEQKIKRKALQHKNYLYAQIINDDVNWKKIDHDWFKFAESNPNATDTLKWWKERVNPKEY